MFTLACSHCGEDNTVNAIPSSKLIQCLHCTQSVHLEAESYYFPRLIMIQGANKGQEFPIASEFTIGRDHANNIQLRERKISRHHSQIEFVNGAYWITDLRSQNGTFVNGNKIMNKAQLQDKDLLRIGDSVLMFRNAYNYFPEAPRTLQVPGAEQAVLAETRSQFERTRAELKFDEQRSFLMSSEQLRNTIEVEKANAKLRILYEVNTAISSILELEDLLSAILDVVFKYIPAGRGAILLQDEQEGLKIAVTKMRKNDGEPMKVSKTIMDRVLEQRVSLLTTDAMLDDALAGAMSIITQGIRSAMSVPLISKERLLGVLHVDTSQKETQFNEDNLELLTGIAGQAAIAIENAKLIQKIEKEIETRGNLQRYLSSELVEQIINKQIDLNIGGELKKSTVLFTDLRGFTKMTERLGAEAVVSILNDYFTRMVDIVFSNEGTLDKFIGDAIMAIWGLPISREKDAMRAVKAAIQMQEELFYFNISQKKHGLDTLKMGGGINTGEMIVGNMGSPKRMEYTVIGPAVNLSSRIESQTQHNQILISEFTYNEVKQYVRGVVEFPPTPLKGIKRPARIFGLVSLRDNNGVIIRFLPIRIPAVQISPSLQCEGLLQEYADKQLSLHVEPSQEIAIGDEFTFNLDVPNIAPEDPVRARCIGKQLNLHGHDEYLEVKAEVIEISPALQMFLEPIFQDSSPEQ